MNDIVPPTKRSEMMRSVKQKDTKPEMQLRRALHARGHRYRLHRRDLPGKPDLVFPSKRAVVFVHGCFWHGHACRKGRLPASNREFWENKISANQERDQRKVSELTAMGWSVLEVWQCELACCRFRGHWVRFA